MTDDDKAAMAADGDLLRRAFAAYFRSPPTSVPGAVVPQQPSEDASDIAELNGKRYVVLADAGGAPMAVYRVRNDGVLKGLRRWPRELGAPQ